MPEVPPAKRAALGSSSRPSASRAMTNEMLRFAKNIPLVAHARRCRIPNAAAARRACPSPPSWLAIFMRAYALAGREHDCVRRAWIPYPRPRLYVHPHSTAGVPVERDWRGETTLLAAKVSAPESQSLRDIAAHLRSFVERPVWDVSDFRQLLRLGRMPALVRRFAFWSTLNWSGRKAPSGSAPSWCRASASSASSRCSRRCA